MTLIAKLLVIAMALPPPWQTGEPVDAYQARVGVIVDAIGETVAEYPKWKPAELAALLTVISYGESKWDPVIHAGGIHRVYHQDHGRAKCLGQLQPSGFVPTREWETLGGTDKAATVRCLTAMARVLSGFRRYCRYERGAMTRHRMAVIIGAYGTGRGCIATPQSRKRAKKWAAMVRKLKL